jgi:hypothetical protein
MESGNNMDAFWKELIKRAGLAFLVLGLILVLFAANGSPLFISGASPFAAIWVIILGVIGGLLAITGVVMTVIEWRASISNTAPNSLPTPSSSSLNDKLDQASILQLQRSGLTRAFRIPVDDNVRLEHVCELIHEEVNKGEGHLRLTASSGYSYLHPNGPVWKSAGMGPLIESGKIKSLEVVLESPFSLFAETRAIANNVTNNQWEEKQRIDQLVRLLQYPNVDLRVTAESITCSLFFTSRAVYYDPYLWSLPNTLGRTENNFWVLEFDRVTDPTSEKLDCYGLLEGHFEFLQKNGIALEKLLHRPEAGGKVPRKEQFFKFYKKSPEIALNNYNALTADFHERITKRMKEK